MPLMICLSDIDLEIVLTIWAALIYKGNFESDSTDENDCMGEMNSVCS